MIQENGKLSLSRRGFLATAAGAGAAYAGYRVVRFQMPTSNARAKVAIVGGGTAGLAIAARLQRALKQPDITLIDPAAEHFYQPGFTLLAAGVFQPDQVVRQQSGLVPSGVRWVQDSAAEIDPDHNRVMTTSHGPVNYDFLVLCPGLQMNFERIEGITRAGLGRGNVHCIYDYRSAQNCWPAIQKLAETGGRAIFSDTWTKLKCGGAPKKIYMIADDWCRKKGSREKVDFQYYSATDHMFDVPLFRKRLEEIWAERKLPLALNHRIRAVDPEKRQVTFEKQPGLERVTLDYDFLHIVPPMSAPDFVRKSPLAVNPKDGKAEDWVPTNKSTLVHARYPNVMCVGDVAGLPTSKTGAAIRMQAPIAAANLISLMEGKAPSLHYDGYTACPFVTEYGKVLMAEFGYDKKPSPTLPLLDPGREHSAGWFLKVHVLPPLYFKGILRGMA
jgi:sulfide:quinone oxidoreductase